MGLTPYREAKAASEWRRSGLLPGSKEEGRRRVWSYAEAIYQDWGCRPGKSIELGLQVEDLLAELTVAAGKRAQGCTWPLPGDRPDDRYGSSCNA